MFYTAKATTKKQKRQPAEWEKIFANDMANKRLKIWLKHWQKMQMAKKHMKGCLTLLIMWNYNKLSPYTSHNGYHQRTQTINVGEDAEKKESLYTVHGNVNWYSHLENGMGVSQNT